MTAYVCPYCRAVLEGTSALRRHWRGCADLPPVVHNTKWDPKLARAHRGPAR